MSRDRLVKEVSSTEVYRRDVVLGTCTRVVLEYKSRVLVLATLSSKYIAKIEELKSKKSRWTYDTPPFQNG